MPEEIADDLVKQVSHRQDEACFLLLLRAGGGRPDMLAQVHDLLRPQVLHRIHAAERNV